MENKEISTSLMVSFVSNPFLAVLYHRIYKRVWRDEIGEILVHMNGLNDEARDFIASLWENDDKVRCIDNMPAEVRQGEAFNRMFPLARGKVLMTMDSDNFVYQKGIIKEYADLVLSGKHDAVGSTGNHAHPSTIAKMLFLKYGVIRLNPYMSFWNMDVVRKIRNITFKTFVFSKGEKVDFLDQPMPIDGYMDVMTRFTAQFMKLSGNYHEINTGEHYKRVHISALSSIYRRCYRGIENTKEQNYVETKHVIPLAYLAWDYLIYEATKNDVPLKKYKQEYFKAFKEEMKKTKVTLADVKEHAKEYLDFHGELFK